MLFDVSPLQIFQVLTRVTYLHNMHNERYVYEADLRLRL